MQPDNYIVKPSEVSGLKRAAKSRSAFTLVEIILAIAVMAIGLLGTLVLFPVGLTATRTASDNTEMATIASEYIALYQQAALNTNDYTSLGLGLQVLTSGPPDSYPIITNDSGAYYYGHIAVRDMGFSPIFGYDASGNLTGTNTISRVTIELWRPGGNTNTYITEVARYGLP
jgi:prepilin-type N-terminal cleavage/methylation domain-containing protein